MRRVLGFVYHAIQKQRGSRLAQEAGPRVTSSNLEFETRVSGMYFWLVPCCSSSHVPVSFPLSSL